MNSASAAKKILRLLKKGARSSFVSERDAVQALDALNLTPRQREDVELAIRAAARVELAAGAKYGTSDYPKILKMFQRKGLVESAMRKQSSLYETVYAVLLERFGEPIGDAPATPGVPDEREEQEEDIDEVAPPGEEKLVRKLKKQPGVDNPWALAWAIHNKRKK